MNRLEIIKKIEDKKIISIVRGISSDEAVLVAEALLCGGIELIEVTFNQKNPNTFDDTARAIKNIKEKFGDRMAVGAGTVLTIEQLMLANDAGAQFIISPDANEEIIKKTVELGMVSIPGAYTATEAVCAHNAGADFVKLFPCIDGAPKYIKALCAPLSHIKFLAVGGVNADNAADFIAVGALGVGVGSSLVNNTWVKERNYKKITEEAKRFVDNISLVSI